MTDNQRLSDVVGNAPLLAVLNRGALPPSTIFAGPSGVGKKTVALRLAARTNCLQPLGNDLCGSCSSCVKAASGNHPDIQLVAPDKTSIKIDQIRDLNQEAQFRPFEGKARFFILDQAERMTAEAANALLKTLEEPPATTHIVLVTAYPARLLATIRSRCQTFTFQPISRHTIIEYLSRETELKDADLRASFANGSIGTALSIDIEATVKDRDALLRLLVDWLRNRSFARIFELCEAEPLRSRIKKREEAVYLLELLQLICYDIYYLTISDSERIVSRDRMEELEKAATRISLESLRQLLYYMMQARRDIERNVNPLICFETLWLEHERVIGT